jgi:hypothetical protein
MCGHLQFRRVEWDVARNLFQRASGAIDGRALAVANGGTFNWLSTTIGSVLAAQILGTLREKKHLFNQSFKKIQDGATHISISPRATIQFCGGASSSVLHTWRRSFRSDFCANSPLTT